MAEAIATSISPNIAFESRSLSTDYEPEGSPANPTGMCGYSFIFLNIYFLVTITSMCMKRNIIS